MSAICWKCLGWAMQVQFEQTHATTATFVGLTFCILHNPPSSPLHNKLMTSAFTSWGSAFPSCGSASVELLRWMSISYRTSHFPFQAQKFAQEHYKPYKPNCTTVTTANSASVIQCWNCRTSGIPARIESMVCLWWEKFSIFKRWSKIIPIFFPRFKFVSSHWDLSNNIKITQFGHVLTFDLYQLSILLHGQNPW